MIEIFWKGFIEIKDQLLEEITTQVNELQQILNCKELFLFNYTFNYFLYNLFKYILGNISKSLKIKDKKDKILESLNGK